MASSHLLEMDSLEIVLQPLGHCCVEDFYAIVVVKTEPNEELSYRHKIAQGPVFNLR